MSAAVVLGALAMGLLGAPHCAVMCGPLAGLGHVEARRHLPVVGPSESARAGLGLVMSQNAGRLLTYSLFGAIAGGAGKIALHAAFATHVQGALELSAALALVLVGIAVVGFVDGRRAVERLMRPLWRRMEPVARSFLPLRTHAGALGFGLVWGFVPCGLVYSALPLALASGSAWEGALTMAAFGSGTLPALVVLSTFVRRVFASGRAPLVRTVAGIAMVCFGVVHLSRGVEHFGRTEPRCCHAPTSTEVRGGISVSR